MKPKKCFNCAIDITPKNKSSMFVDVDFGNYVEKNYPVCKKCRKEVLKKWKEEK
jgi:predicted RNA-binding Zn-ribbon protein involved in translation (DUF1610 family)